MKISTAISTLTLVLALSRGSLFTADAAYTRGGASSTTNDLVLSTDAVSEGEIIMPEGYWDKGFMGMTDEERLDLYEYIKLMENPEERNRIILGWGGKDVGEECKYPVPNCKKGLKCSTFLKGIPGDRYWHAHYRNGQWNDALVQTKPGMCVYDGTNGRDVPGYPAVTPGIDSPMAYLYPDHPKNRSKCIPTAWPDAVTGRPGGVHGPATAQSCCSGTTYLNGGNFRCL